MTDHPHNTAARTMTYAEYAAIQAINATSIKAGRTVTP